MGDNVESHRNAEPTVGAGAEPRIAFILLAHHAPWQVVELASCLAATATDAQVWIHWDLNASIELPAELVELSANDDRVHLVTDRVRCEWGKFGLVEAPLNALREIRASNFRPDVAVLLSGSCLPCRPVAELERFLAERPGADFIEDHDDSWMVDGWRAERWQYRHWFQHQRHPRLEHWGYKVQRLVRAKRRFPERFKPRFGSQWWALSWRTAEAILDDIAADQKSFHFFKTVWIPDEMMFQTYVHKLGRPAGYNLTHFQFTDRGKPVVYYDDHVDYVPTLDFFFVRKVAPQATALRKRLVSLAAEPDTGRSLDSVGTKRDDYALTVRAQTWYPEPGHIYYRNQYADMPSSVLSSLPAPYVVLLGPSQLTMKFGQRLTHDGFCVLGEVFRAGCVDFGNAVVPGLHRDAAGVRDIDPANFLVRVRRRCSGVPVIRWGLGDCPALLQSVLRDPAALIVPLVPWSGDKVASATLAKLATVRSTSLPAALHGGSAEDRRQQRAWLDTALEIAAREHDCPHWLAGELFEGSPNSWIRAGLVTAAWGIGRRPLGLSGPVADLFDRPGAATERAETLARSLEISTFADEPWFHQIADAAERFLSESSDGVRPFVKCLNDILEK